LLRLDHRVNVACIEVGLETIVAAMNVNQIVHNLIILARPEILRITVIRAIPDVGWRGHDRVFLKHHSVVQERQYVFISVDLVKLDVKAGEQVQHVVLMKAHFLQSAELKLYPLRDHAVFKLVERDASFKVPQIGHLVHQIIGEVLRELGALHTDRVLLESTIAFRVLWCRQNWCDPLAFIRKCMKQIVCDVITFSFELVATDPAEAL
jgi:hypothetical protein